MSAVSEPSSEDSAPTQQTGKAGTAKAAGLTAGGAALFLLLRMFAVSNWDWHTAAEALGTIDFGNVIPVGFGTLVAAPAITAIIIVWLLPLAVLNALWPTRLGANYRLSQLMIAIALSVAFIALVKTFAWWWLVIAAVVVAGLVTGARLMWRRGAGRTIVRGILHHAGITAVVAILILAAVVRTPWTPKEEITTTDGVVTGYVLKVESGYLQVLTSGDRKMEIIVGSDVVARDVVN